MKPVFINYFAPSPILSHLKNPRKEENFPVMITIFYCDYYFKNIYILDRISKRAPSFVTGH